MRKFKLTNANGQEFDLMRKDAFFHNPSGLGFGITPELQRIGDTFIVINRDENQSNPSGDISFRGYEEYEEFRQFVAVGGLAFGYKPLHNWMYLPVDIEVEKTEIDEKTHRLECSVQFTGTGYWYEKNIAYRSEQNSNNGKIYTYTYPYTYANNLPGVIDIQNGQKPSYCRIHIMGPVVNPAFILSRNGKQIATGKINRTVVSGRKIIIDSRPEAMEISEYTTDGQFIADIYSMSDFTTERFVQVPAGKSRFSFTHDEISEVIAWVEVEKRV